MRALVSTLVGPSFVVLALVACVRSANSESVSANVAQAQPTLPPAPHISTAPAPTAAPKRSAAPDASPTPSGPQILSVVTTPTIVHTGDAVTWDVRTTTDVVGVTAHVSIYTLPLAPHGAGHFLLGFTIPAGVPAIFHGNYNLEITAHAKNGETAKRIVPMVFR